MKKSKSFLILLLSVWLLLPCSLSADIILTDQEYNLLMKNLEEARTLQNEQKTRIMNLESDLMKAQEEQKSLVNDLTNAKKEQQESNKIIKELRSDLKRVSTSLEKLKSDHKKDKLKSNLIVGSTSFILGTGTGMVIENKRK